MKAIKSRNAHQGVDLLNSGIRHFAILLLEKMALSMKERISIAIVIFLSLCRIVGWN